MHRSCQVPCGLSFLLIVCVSFPGLCPAGITWGTGAGALLSSAVALGLAEGVVWAPRDRLTNHPDSVMAPMETHDYFPQWPWPWLCCWSPWTQSQGFIRQGAQRGQKQPQHFHPHGLPLVGPPGLLSGGWLPREKKGKLPIPLRSGLGGLPPSLALGPADTDWQTFSVMDQLVSISVLRAIWSLSE